MPTGEMPTHKIISCPSAQPDQPDAAIIGVVHREGAACHVELLRNSVPSDLLIGLVPAKVRPTELLRFAAPCAESMCAHFHEDECKLAKRIVSRLPEATDHLRPCAIRPTCRWFRQEGAAACRRCPLVITEPYNATGLMREVAVPSKRGAGSDGESI
jgi:hypothetical protein